MHYQHQCEMCSLVLVVLVLCVRVADLALLHVANEGYSVASGLPSHVRCLGAGVLCSTMVDGCVANESAWAHELSGWTEGVARM